jgi:hypothetical protein
LKRALPSCIAVGMQDYAFVEWGQDDPEQIVQAIEQGQEAVISLLTTTTLPWEDAVSIAASVPRNHWEDVTVCYARPQARRALGLALLIVANGAQ